jgi:hypothetical protein
VEKTLMRSPRGPAEAAVQRIRAGPERRRPAGRRVLPALACVFALLPLAAHAQTDPVVGNWRGTITSAAGTETPFVLTIGKNGDRYLGSTSGLAEGGDVALRTLDVAGTSMTIEAAAESRMGTVAISASLAAEGNTLKGDGTLAMGNQRFPVSFTLQRRPRADVVQHQVEQKADYFVGHWNFAYVGGEFPPLSIGNREGSVTFAREGASNFLSGTLQGSSYGTPFTDRLSIGVDADTDMIVLDEKRQGGTELLALGNWRSPLAVVFVTSPVQSGGKTYQLKRVFSILSESAFDLTEEFSVDGGPFRRLGQGHFTKQ